ncbi:MAG: tetratricopeptide repeat protein [Chloroflexota bacterium]|nr:tetratricopeptide repeat protein [Chloroflexota bacterium]
MMGASRALVLCGLLLTACGAPTPMPQRLPTRAPTTEGRGVELEPEMEVEAPGAIPAQEYYAQGVERQRVGDVEGALQHLTWAIRRDPSLAAAYVSRGCVHLARGEAESALGDAAAALELEPSTQAFLLQAEALRLLGRHQDALSAFDAALEHDPGLQGDTFNARWWAARAARDGSRLAALRDEFAARHPDDPLAYYYRGWATIEAGEEMEAVRLLMKGIEGTAHPPAVLWYALGRAYAQREAWQEAITALEVARSLLEAGDASLGLHAEQPVAHLFVALGEAYLGAGRCADARTTLAYAGSIGAPAPLYMPALQEAQLCGPPTPTASP